jgi:hypothetical protein
LRKVSENDWKIIYYLYAPQPLHDDNTFGFLSSHFLHTQLSVELLTLGFIGGTLLKFNPFPGRSNTKLRLQKDKHYFYR